VVPISGVASFTGLTVDRLGTFSLTASGSGVQTTSGTFQVTGAATATQLAFVMQPTTTPAGQSMNLIQVAVEDAFGNIVSNANNPVAIALGANPSGAALSALSPGTTSTLASGGYATFYYLTINFAGLGYTMVASSPGLKSATSVPFNISGAGPPATLTPSSMREGTSVSVTITAQNANFQQGVTTASFGPGLMVGNGLMGGFGPVTVTSPTTAVAQVSAAAKASPGLRTVWLQTGATQLSFFDAFTVMGSPVLESISPASGQPGQTLSVTINAMFTNFVQGTTQANFGPGISVGGGAQGAFGPVTVNGLGTAVAQITIASGALVGLRPITAQTGTEVATSPNGGFLVLGPVTGPAPVFNFTSLTEGMEITAPTSVAGTITSPNLATWTLDYAPVGSNSITTFAAGTTLAVSGALDPTLLLNGMITVRLTAVDQSGQTTVTTVDVLVTRKLKVGNFTLSFLDLNIPVAGIPIQIVRTYDSRDKTVGDFGIGWSLSVKSVRMDTNGILGKNWIGTSNGAVVPTYCVQPGQNHVVSARMQDGTVYQFVPTPTPATQCALALPPQFVDLTFVPTGSTPPSAQLTQTNSTGLMVIGGSPGPLVLADPFTFQAYGYGGDTDQWTLTRPNGQKIQVSVSFGVQAITDTNGNTLSIGPTGITSSSGPAVTFTRDALNRITAIRDPNANLLQYAYDSNGDLHTVVDQRNYTSQFAYDSVHDLVSYTDPTGAQPIRNVYDDSGRLIQQIDAFGHVQDFTHNLAANTENFTDFLGNTTTYVYDNHGNIIQQTDPLGNVISSTYDANDNLLTQANGLGKTSSYTYDANNNRLSVTDPLGNTTRFTYNTLNQVLTKTDPIGNTTRSTYDSAGNLLTRTDPLGNTTTHTYNGGLLATTKDPLGNTTAYTYLRATPLSMTDPLGNVTSFTYDSNQNRVSQTVVRTTATGQQSLTTRYQYDAQNRLVQTTFPDGSVSQTVFNALGQQAATIDELGRQTSYSYDAQHRLVSTTYADGTTETTTSDAVGNMVASTDRSGATTTYTYDPLHRLLATTDPLGAVMSSTYDAAGQRTSRTDARGNTMRYAYDDAGRQTTITNPLGELTQLTLDSRGLRISAKDKAGHVTSFQRDAMGRITQATLADGSIDTIAYDARGNVASRKDAAGKTTLFAHDSLRRLVSVTDALGHTTGYVYDEVGNRTMITDANGHITPFQYDQRGRRISRTLPSGQSETLAYDAAGEVTSHTDFNGKTMTYQYDSAGRLLSKTPDPSFNSPAVRYTYTGLGRRASMTDVSGTTTYRYDLLGRLTSKQSPEGNITYAYDPAGNLISLQAGALTVSYAYDSLNRLASVTEPSTGTTAYSYDLAGNLQNSTYPNGVAHAYSYDSLNRLTTLAVNKGSSPVASYAQTLGPTGRLLSVAELGGRTVNYTYDAVYRLAGESVALAMSGLNGSVGYAYDAVGNRTQTISTLAGVSSVSFGYDVDDRLSADTYDAAGNTVSSGGLGNLYDFENRLVQRGSVSIVYDGDGNRVSETAGGVTTKYLIDDQNPTGFSQVIAETGSDGGTRTFVYGLERISQLQFIPSSNSSVTSFYIYDGHGSVRALANPAGAITDTYDYDAFGNLINRTGTTVNNYMFAGEPFDPALGIYYNRARYYDERRGRFWTLDTLEGNPSDPQSLHKYLYTRADPVNRRDPSGHEDIAEEVVATEISVELDSMAVAEPFAATVLEANTIVEVSAFADTILEAAAIVEAEGVPAAVEALAAETAGAAAESLVPAAALTEGQLAAIAAENQVVYNALINLVGYPLTAAEEALLEQEIEITLELAVEREIAADTALSRFISHLRGVGFW
jgi:RHS repeat-associated protein